MAEWGVWSLKADFLCPKSGHRITWLDHHGNLSRAPHVVWKRKEVKQQAAVEAVGILGLSFQTSRIITANRRHRAVFRRLHRSDTRCKNDEERNAPLRMCPCSAPQNYSERTVISLLGSFTKLKTLLENFGPELSVALVVVRRSSHLLLSGRCARHALGCSLSAGSSHSRAELPYLSSGNLFLSQQ